MMNQSLIKTNNNIFCFTKDDRYENKLINKFYKINGNKFKSK